jgi:hypothetical protein
MPPIKVTGPWPTVADTARIYDLKPQIVAAITKMFSASAQKRVTGVRGHAALRCRTGRAHESCAQSGVKPGRCEAVAEEYGRRCHRHAAPGARVCWQHARRRP